MSSDLAVEVSNLSKVYHIYERPQDRLKQILWPGRRQFYREFWALADVSFAVPRGETVGIIGRNGSGKSTLLQLISGTLTPTRGQISVRGHVAALLELGAGFNPEFTGRENVHMNGTLMGLTRKQIDERYDAIVAFADIGDFLEQPVKTYSSGMSVRLAFAIAAHVDPEILIIDEALSVGDLLFQFKCFLKFQELQAMGKTILFVSHDVNTVKKYCSRAVLLEGGHLVLVGSPNAVVNRYTTLLFPKRPSSADRAHAVVSSASAVDVKTSEREHRYGSGDGEIACISLHDSSGQPGTTFTAGERIRVAFRVVACRAIDRPILAMTIRDAKGQDIYVTNTHFQGVHVPALNPGDAIDVSFVQNLALIPSTYFLCLGFVYLEDSSVVPLDRRYDVVEIRVLPRDGDLSTGIADLQSEITVTDVSAQSGGCEQTPPPLERVRH